MANNSTETGIMDTEYSNKREKNLPLIYRYQVRALMAVKAYRDFHPNTIPDVLDLGAADGKTLLAMRSYFSEKGTYTGVELSESLLQEVPDLPEDTRIIKGDVIALPDGLKPASFDMCTSLAVLEHLPEPVACVKEAYRMLRPGGVFVASSPSPFWDRIAGVLGLVDEDFHQQKVTLEDLRIWANKAGFETVITKPFMWVVTGILPYLGLSIEPNNSLQIDAAIRKIDITNFSFVNQALIAQKKP